MGEKYIFFVETLSVEVPEDFDHHAISFFKCLLSLTLFILIEKILLLNFG